LFSASFCVNASNNIKDTNYTNCANSTNNINSSNGVTSSSIIREKRLPAWIDSKTRKVAQ
jgi:hypothetical protein